jgi:hypothetical protein
MGPPEVERTQARQRNGKKRAVIAHPRSRSYPHRAKLGVSTLDEEEMAEKILQINFKFRASTPDYQRLCGSIADSFAAVSGLRWKIWLLNDRDAEAGGIYLFESDRTVNEFLSGPLVAEVKGHPALYDLQAKVFDVMPDVSEITRGPVATMAAA